MQERISFKDTSTVSETLAAMKVKSITRTKLSLLESVRTDVIMNGNSILNDYIDEIDQCTVKYDMATDEIDRYYMRPDLFAYDKLGDKDYDFLILFINGILSPKEFTNSTVKTIDRDYVGTILGLIISAETDYLNFNKTNYKNGAF